MIEDAVTEHRGLTEVVFTAADLISGSSESKRAKTAETLLNILEGRIRNPNTRNAYKTAWRSFFEFCSEYKLELDRVKPYHFGLWFKRHTGSLATQRQHLAAVRLLFVHIRKKGVVDTNPAARAKPPRLERESVHTPVFEQHEIKTFLEAIKGDSLIDKRDKALFAVLLYSWARVSAVVALKVEHYYERKGERWLRLHEKRGKIHEVPVHSKAREAIDQWLLASDLRAIVGVKLRGKGPCAPLKICIFSLTVGRWRTEGSKRGDIITMSIQKKDDDEEALHSFLLAVVRSRPFNTVWASWKPFVTILTRAFWSEKLTASLDIFTELNMPRNATWTDREPGKMPEMRLVARDPFKQKGSY